MFKVALANTSSSLAEAGQILEQIRSENPKHWPHGLTVGHFDGGLYLVRDKQANAAVGFVGWQERQEGLTKVGYYAIGILPEHRQQGFARDAVATMLAKKAHGVDQVRAAIVEGNTPSVRLADGLGVARKMIKKAEADSHRVDPWLLGSGLGVTGVNQAFRPLNRIMDVQDPAALSRQLSNFKTLSTPAVASADFPYLYSQMGHDLMNQKMRSGNSVTSSAEGLRRSKRMLVPVLNHMPAWSKNLNIMAPGQMFDRFNGQPPTNKRFTLNDLHAGLQEQVKDRGVHKHYQQFAESPLAAYQQTLNEIGEGLGNRPLGDVKQNLAHSLVLPAEQRSAYLNKLYSKEMASAGDFNPLMDYLEKHLTLQRPGQRNFNNVLTAMNESELFKNLRNDVGVVSHVNDYIGSGKNRAFDTLGELRNKRHFLQLWTDPVLTGTFRNAPARYGRLGDASLIIKGLGGRPMQWLGLGALGASAYPALRHWREKRGSAERPNRMTATDTLAAATALGSAGMAASYGNQQRWKLNPLARPNVLVLGGVSPTGPTANRPMDSFSTQTHAVANSLRENSDARVKVRQAFRPEVSGYGAEASGGVYGGGYGAGVKQKFFEPVNFGNTLKSRGDLYDAIVQVGATPDDAYLKSRMRDHLLRYRALTDFGQGNLHQPEIWLGARNWMRVHDQDPGSYTRLFAPGATAEDLAKFKKMTDFDSIATSSIPVNKAFHDVAFQPKVNTGPVRATLSMGGGAGGFMMVPEAKQTLAGGQMRYNPDQHTVLDDIVTALKEKHGANFQLDVLTGGANQVAAGKPGNRPLADFLHELEKRKAAGDPRFSNINFHGRVPQVSTNGMSVADAYAKSHYLFQLPGSTTAELLSMPGEHVGKVINLVPDETPNWMPKHYGRNDDFVRRHLPSARRLSINSSSRLDDLRKIIGEGLPEAMVGRSPVRADYSNVAKIVQGDIKRLKLNRLAKFGLLGLPGVAAGTYLAGRASDYMRPDVSDMSLLERLKHTVKKLTQ